MQHDPILLANTREWLLLAREDLRAAHHSLNADPPLVRSALFHCQQCVEKALKALLTWRDRAFRKTHSLEEIGELCLQDDPDLVTVVDRVAPLTKYAVRFRYPGAPWDPSPSEAQDAVAIAGESLAIILRRLPVEVHHHLGGAEK